jgi:glycosyltransferase involved in cell wall biosynthesis
MPETSNPEADRPFLSVVAPVFNEAEGLAQFCTDLRAVLDELLVSYEVLLVDDGSTDDSIGIAVGLGWPQCTVVSLARNVGHQVALEAGLTLAHGTWIISMDSDGQHPVGLIPTMLDLGTSQSLDIIYTARLLRRDDGFAKRTAALAYYRAIRGLTGVAVANSQADFRMVSRRVLGEVLAVPGDKVLRLLLPSIGYRSAVIPYEALPRIAGVGRFGVRRQFKMARESILGFSSKPLRLVATLGIVLSGAAMGWLIVVLLTYVATRTITGWASVMTAVLLVGGLTLLSLSIVGEYVARVYDLLKGHPRYSIARVFPSIHPDDARG